MSWDGDTSLSRALASSLPGAVLLLLFLPALCLGQSTKVKVCLCLPPRPPLPGSEALGRLLVPSGEFWGERRGMFSQVFLLFQAVPWKDKEPCWLVPG